MTDRAQKAERFIYTDDEGLRVCNRCHMQEDECICDKFVPLSDKVFLATVTKGDFRQNVEAYEKVDVVAAVERLMREVSLRVDNDGFIFEGQVFEVIKSIFGEVKR